MVTVHEEKILGMRWLPKDDYFAFQVKINFSPKRNKIPTGPDLTEESFDKEFPEILTRRMVLSQAARIYDPFGFITPVTLSAKILLRNLVSQPTEGRTEATSIRWDDPIPDGCKQAWKQFFKELYKLKETTFARCLRPENAVGEPILIIFSDASIQAYGACAYVQWKLNTGEYETRLIAAKQRIAPTRQLTIPRLELCGAVLGCRLRKTIQQEMNFIYKTVIHVVDSAIVRAQIQKESYGFGSFVATKVAEIQNHSEPNEWWWIATADNPADMLTRPTRPCQIGPESVWQRGPAFLSLPIEQWPISQALQVQERDLPDRIGVHIAQVTNLFENYDIGDVVKLENFNGYIKLLRVTARIIRVKKQKTFGATLESPTAIELLEAEIHWVKHAQRELVTTDWENRYKRLGPSLNSDGLLVVGQRMKKWLKDDWNQELFILLPANHRFTELYIRYIHATDHAGIEVTMAKVQRKFWVPGARRVIKQVKYQCVTCRKLDKKLQTQMMGELGPERLQSSPPFHHTALDLFGPFVIRDTVKKRTKTKAYGIIFNCLATRAVYLDLVDGYGTNDFLVTFRRFVTIRGFPATIHSDRGSQLTAASKELREMTKSLHWEDICQFGVSEGVKWTFNRSADAPWQNGCSEALIRLVKRALVCAVGDSVLTAGELQTALFEAANLLNQRPIGHKPGADPMLGTYLCPNDLLLGRSDIAVPQGNWDESKGFTKRIRTIQQIVTVFWKKWQRDYFSTLLVRQRWHVARRNLKIGDIVLIQDTNALKGNWKFAEVLEVHVDQDGKVRNVTLRYKSQAPPRNATDARKYNGQPDVIVKRSVHRLVLLLESHEDDDVE
ncbi:uncharacterized protein LOC122366428 [Amphibalanus amphitrite]|uniref:uncharacterized protein LOC122365483 n=1 Tax=Amphibalanus amphitrite TaxID=1232801 RepID=UPI001C901AC7|nr:uncharacterized protein LOC122365483 [Amphibalanus amphitrite]XP_043194608.1 uncharacterized protein LOC122366428 [Amphibalanus amphitrite]